MLDDLNKFKSKYVTYSGYIPSISRRNPSLKIGSNTYNMDKDKDFYNEISNPEYFSNINNNISMKNSLNDKCRFIPTYKNDYQFDNSAISRSTSNIDDLIKYKHNQRSLTNNINFMYNIKSQVKDKNDTEEKQENKTKFKVISKGCFTTTNKDSYKYDENYICKNEINPLFLDKSRINRSLNEDTEYRNSINCINPIFDKRLIKMNNDEVVGDKFYHEDEKDYLIKKSLNDYNNFKASNKQISNFNNEVDRKKPLIKESRRKNQLLRYEYDNKGINQGTNRSVSLSNLAMIHVPANKLYNVNESYLNQNSNLNKNNKLKDFFIKNNKVLPVENFHLKIPGYTGHESSNLNNHKSKERKFCLSIEKNSS